MAGRIQGITVEIGGDTTKLQNALKGVNGQIKSTQQQLKDVDKLLKLDPGNTELLAQAPWRSSRGNERETYYFKGSRRTGKYSPCKWRDFAVTV